MDVLQQKCYVGAWVATYFSQISHVIFFCVATLLWKFMMKVNRDEEMNIKKIIWKSFAILKISLTKGN